MQEEWHRDERKCTLVILTHDLLLIDLNIVVTNAHSVAVASPSLRQSPLPSPRPSPAAVALCAAAALPLPPRRRHAAAKLPPP